VSARCDVLVVGGGPVGLLLGGLLAQRGVDVRVLEKREKPSARSRAIGIHPPGLSCLDAVGVATPLIASGVKVERGHALMHGKSLGVVDFTALPPPFAFVLSVPQQVTERLLAARLTALSPRALTRDAEALSYAVDRDGVDVRLRVAGERRDLRARYVVGCDGRHSTVRTAMAARYRGHAYPGRFAMADAADDTALGDEAVVFVDGRGLIESFPLPDQRRRWVVSFGTHTPQLAPESFAELIRARTGQSLDSRGISEVSEFSAERFCAQHFVRDRLVLAGDAAHVVSPIGGQGMNMGWLDARALARALSSCLRDRAGSTTALADYAHSRKKLSLRAARRAELYMALGFAAPLWLRAWSLRALTSAPAARHATRFFTMQGLDA
jgi:2-polyprenyl-6-methoxyphenol hydroxylase-like FAD-dependent oxidoreductase